MNACPKKFVLLFHTCSGVCISYLIITSTPIDPNCQRRRIVCCRSATRSIAQGRKDGARGWWWYNQLVIVNATAIQWEWPQFGATRRQRAALGNVKYSHWWINQMMWIIFSPEAMKNPNTCYHCVRPIFPFLCWITNNAYMGIIAHCDAV